MNNRIFHIATALLLTLLSTLPVHAGGMGGIAVQGFMPNGEFRENVGKNAFGIGGHLVWKPENQPFTIGGYIDYTPYGSSTTKSPLVRNVSVDVKTTNSALNLGLLFQFMPFDGAIQPYLEGLAGFINMRTITELDSELNTGDNQTFAASEDSSDWTFATGFGLGILVKVHESKWKGSGPSAWYIDLKYRRISGGKARYIKEETIDIDENNTPIYNFFESHVTYDVVQLGVTVEF